MSVLLKGIEMPKDSERPYWVVIHSDGIVEYNENKGQGWQISEAVPVPPHGRLGDLDALKVSLAFADKTAKWAVPALRAALMVIDEMPTIVPAEDGK